jgi:hypothetical protein
MAIQLEAPDRASARAYRAVRGSAWSFSRLTFSYHALIYEEYMSGCH